LSTLLQAEAIRVEFRPLVAVRDLSFEVAGGELVGLVGPNGAGKTTLLRVLAGLHAPTCGTARIMGKPVLGEHEVVRHHVGFAPDSPPAYEELTIDQFLRFIAGAYRLEHDEGEERIEFWLEQLWLTEKRYTLVKHLSRGMRQRVTLARTFIPRPHVILLDEPLSGLDPAGRIQLRKVLSMLRAQGCAMIVSSHILADLEEVATHIAIIEHGSILRWSRTEALQHHEEDRRVYRLRTLGVNPEHTEWLASLPGVAKLEVDTREYTFTYEADETAVAALVSQIAQRGIPIVSFSMIKTSLEDAYLRAGVKQVD
jgi:ABC-2 type transport system ATP-binding protein